MKEEKLVAYTRVHSEDGPSKNLFDLTQLGRTELERWQREPGDVVSVWRDPIVNKVWFGILIEKDAIINDLKSLIDARTANLEYYERKREELIGHPSKQKNSALSRFYRSSAFDCAISRCKADIDWAEIVIQKLSSMSTDSLKIGNGSKKKKVFITTKRPGNYRTKPKPATSSM